MAENEQEKEARRRARGKLREAMFLAHKNGVSFESMVQLAQSLASWEKE